MCPNTHGSIFSRRFGAPGQEISIEDLQAEDGAGHFEAVPEFESAAVHREEDQLGAPMDPDETRALVSGLEIKVISMFGLEIGGLEAGGWLLFLFGFIGQLDDGK